MAKSIFEEMGGTYTQVGDCFLPDLRLPKEEIKSIGIWGDGTYGISRSINDCSILIC